MNPAERHLIEAIHGAEGKCVMAVTGGGAGAAAMLLAVPGASRTVLEVIVPYDGRALADFLGARPEQSCSASTAHAMAERACSRARGLAPGAKVVGVGCTASLASDRPKRGDHRFYLGIRSALSTVYSLTFQKDARDRAGEEALLDRIILNGLAEALGIGERLPTDLKAGEILQVANPADDSPLDAFLRGELPAVHIDIDGRVSESRQSPAGLVPGAFNPLHDAHCQLARVAGQVVGEPIALELSVTNVDKPALGPEAIRERLGQLVWKAPVWVTRAPTFREKAALFPRARLVVGADTAQRVIDPRYYGNDERAMLEALAEIKARGCRFLVAGRVDSTGRFLELGDVPIPGTLRDLFEAIPEQLFRMDISSTQIRARQASPLAT